MPELERLKKQKVGKEEARQREDMARLQTDLAASSIRDKVGNAPGAGDNKGGEGSGLATDQSSKGTEALIGDTVGASRGLRGPQDGINTELTDDDMDEGDGRMDDML